MDKQREDVESYYINMRENERNKAPNSGIFYTPWYLQSYLSDIPNWSNAIELLTSARKLRNKE
jgi:hypothetical protein